MDPFKVLHMAMGDDVCPRCQRPLSEYPTEVWAQGRGDQPTVLAHELKYCQSMGWWNAHREQMKAEHHLSFSARGVRSNPPLSPRGGEGGI